MTTQQANNQYSNQATQSRCSGPALNATTGIQTQRGLVPSPQMQQPQYILQQSRALLPTVEVSLIKNRKFKILSTGVKVEYDEFLVEPLLIPHPFGIFICAKIHLNRYSFSFCLNTLFAHHISSLFIF